MTEAFDKGINCFDITQKHGSDLAETVLGRVFHCTGGWQRNQVVVSTRFVWNDSRVPTFAKDVAGRHIREDVQTILDRLQLGYVDMMYADFPHPQSCSS